VSIVNVTDPNNDEVTITITGVTQDEPVNGLGDGNSGADAVLQGGQMLLRAERAATGNGRVYGVRFSATDNQVTGSSCSGAVLVRVPANIKSAYFTVDDGQAFDSAQP